MNITMKWYRFTMKNGDVIYVNTPTKRLAWLVFRQDCTQYWGKEVEKVGCVRKVPESPDYQQVIVVVAI